MKSVVRWRNSRETIDYKPFAEEKLLGLIAINEFNLYVKEQNGDHPQFLDQLV
jgi:hypothetical protein